MGRLDRAITDSLTGCHYCGFDLGKSLPQMVIRYDEAASNWLESLCWQFFCPPSTGILDLDKFNVMRQLAMLLTSRYATVKLHTHICNEMGVDELELVKGRIPFESRSLTSDTIWPN
jgi:hypothetical protein